jgi:hypothetical protein
MYRDILYTPARAEREQEQPKKSRGKRWIYENNVQFVVTAVRREKFLATVCQEFRISRRMGVFMAEAL